MDQPVPEVVLVYPQLFFPKFPKPSASIIIPFDSDLKRIKENDYETEIVWDMIPHWYLQQILKYKLDVDVCETEYTSFVQHCNDNIYEEGKNR